MKITISQIAQMAGVSRGTVDRVIHKRGRVAPEVEKTINKIIAEYDYQPNAIGSALAKSKSYKIGVIIIEKYNPFFDIIKAGAEEAIKLYRDYNISLELEHLSGLSEDDYLAALNKLENEVDGFVVVGHNTKKITAKVNSIIEKGIPFVTMNIDLYDSKRACYVGIDDYQGGMCIGGIVKDIIKPGERILLMSGHQENKAEHARLEGFYQVLKNYPEIAVSDVYYTFDDPVNVQLLAKRILKQESYQMVVMMGYGVNAIGKAVDELGLKTYPKVLGFDLVPDHREALLLDKILYLVDQSAHEQSRQAIIYMCEYLLHHKPLPVGNQHLPIHIYNKYSV